MVKIEHDVSACIGCGACHGVCPDNWEQKEIGGSIKFVPKKTELDEVGCNEEAANICPVKCIKIVK